MVVDLPEPAAPKQQDQAAALHHEVLQDLGQVQLVEPRDVVRNEADHGRHRAALQEGAEAEAAHALDRQRDVQFAGVLEFAELGVRDALGQQRDDRLRGEPVTWLIGTQTPLILIVIGDPTERNRSDADFSAIRLNRRSSDIGDPDMARRPSLRLQRKNRRVARACEYLQMGEKGGVRPCPGP